MIHTIQEFEREWDYERQGTSKLMHELTDASLTRYIARDHRTLGRLAWHLTTSISEMMGRVGIKVDGPGPDAAMPATAKAMAEGYDHASRSVLEMIKREWTDETLAIEDDMYGEKWARGFTLEVLLCHQIHHRGQLTVLMRQSGLRVHGIYGPAREEWSAFGAKPPEI